MKRKKVNKLRTSKLVMWIFIGLFILAIFKGIIFTPNDIQDTAIYCGCITACTTILGIVLAHYYNSSIRENLPRIQTSLYKETLDLRYEYDVKRAELMYTYNLSKEDIEEFESDFNIDEVNDGVLDQAVAELNDRASRSHQDLEPPSY